MAGVAVTVVETCAGAFTTGVAAAGAGVGVVATLEIGAGAGVGSGVFGTLAGVVYPEEEGVELEDD